VGFASSYSGAWSFEGNVPNHTGTLSTFTTLIKRTIRQVGRRAGVGQG
jgi:hypothetical protein